MYNSAVPGDLHSKGNSNRYCDVGATSNSMSIRHLTREKLAVFRGSATCSTCQLASSRALPTPWAAATSENHSLRLATQHRSSTPWYLPPARELLHHHNSTQQKHATDCRPVQDPPEMQEAFNQTASRSALLASALLLWSCSLASSAPSFALCCFTTARWAPSATAGAASAPAAADDNEWCLLLLLFFSRGLPSPLARLLLWLLVLLLLLAPRPPDRPLRSTTSTVTLSRVPRSSAALVSEVAARLAAPTPLWPEASAAWQTVQNRRQSESHSTSGGSLDCRMQHAANKGW